MVISPTWTCCSHTTQTSKSKTIKSLKSTEKDIQTAVAARVRVTSRAAPSQVSSAGGTCLVRDCVEEAIHSPSFLILVECADENVQSKCIIQRTVVFYSRKRCSWRYVLCQIVVTFLQMEWQKMILMMQYEPEHMNSFKLDSVRSDQIFTVIVQVPASENEIIIWP